MPRKKAESKTQKSSVSQSQPKSGFSDYFRFGESYTSLILGMVVVILAIILVVALFRNRNFSGVINPQPKQDVSSTSTGPKEQAGKAENTQGALKSGSVYKVQAGDTLWSIAERTYKSGYNWVDIAQANNLTANPGAIDTGMSLKLPQVTPKMATVNTGKQGSVSSVPNAISTNTYTVQHGDCLWTIAVRAYGDGYKWSEIANANNIRSPDLIYSGTVLKLPRS